MHHKRKKPRNARAGCKMCKPWKVNGFATERAEGERFSDHKRRVWAGDQIKHLMVIFATALLLSACSIPGMASCADQSEAFFGQIEPLARRWDDANKLAGQTPRAQLAGQIASLQAVRRDVQDLKPPECSTPVQTALIGTMDATIQGYVDFLSQKPDSVVQASFTTAGEQMAAYTAALAAARGLAPTATP